MSKKSKDSCHEHHQAEKLNFSSSKFREKFLAAVYITFTPRFSLNFWFAPFWSLWTNAPGVCSLLAWRKENYWSPGIKRVVQSTSSNHGHESGVVRCTFVVCCVVCVFVAFVMRVTNSRHHGSRNERRRGKEDEEDERKGRNIRRRRSIEMRKRSAHGGVRQYKIM